MGTSAMAPHGAALEACSRGEAGAELLVRRDDGLEVSIPASFFFREPSRFSPMEKTALERARGRVLDIGAGTGLHSLDLLSRGRTVTAIDVSPEAVRVMKSRGVPDARCADIFEFRGGPFDTLLMLGHGIGIAGDLEGLARLLSHAGRLARGGGQLLVDSNDVRRTDDPAHLAYHEANRRAGRYFGETRVQFEYAGKTGPFCGWLHVDPDTLRERAATAGWDCQVLLEEPGGDYLACLINRQGASAPG